MIRLNNLLKRRMLYLDGATGTNLLDKGLSPGESPSVLNLRNPQAVYDLHKNYVDAGSDIILTNTFSANPQNYSSSKLRAVITEGIKLARRAAKNRVVFGDIGPMGELTRPFGDKHFDEAVKDYKRIFNIFSQSNINTFLIETFTSILEAKAAFLAARDFSESIFVSFSLQKNGRTLMGEIPESIAVTFEALGASGIGINCTSPEVALEAISRMTEVTNLPLIVKPNAGRVEIVGNQVKHTMSDRNVADYYRDFVHAGANIIGGCCGTTPEYIRIIAKKKVRPVFKKAKKVFVLASPSKILQVETDSTVIVGERLNPSGCKTVKKRLLQKDYRVYGEEAKAQEVAGANALDVNAFVIDLDERETLLHAVYEVLKSSTLPLFIDTRNYEAAKKVLRFYPGIGVFNSIPAQKKELLKWLPLVKEYGFKAVISLVGKTIPQTRKERIENVNIALNISKSVGFPSHDLIFDPLVFSAATHNKQIKYTLETVGSLYNKGLKTILGISNVSFGLPARSLLNSALISAAVKSGSTFLILNPLDKTVTCAVDATRALFRDELLTYIKKNKQIVKHEPKKFDDLLDALIYGDDKRSSELSKDLLKRGISPQTLIDKYLAKALKMVGDRYEQGIYFIPDLLRSAEATKCMLSVVKDYLPQGKRGGKIVLATVKGDIHDIGKNIAGMIFESAGYEVIDLGKDVPTKRIVDAVRNHKPDFLGLSALLTTTMLEMKNVIDELKKKKLRVKVIIGGPNVSSDYARKIGAFGAARNAFEGLNLVKQ